MKRKKMKTAERKKTGHGERLSEEKKAF